MKEIYVIMKIKDLEKINDLNKIKKYQLEVKK
jgi:hypothetical protein